MMAWLKRTTRRVLARLGWHIQRTSDTPRFNLLGLRAMGFRTILDIGANEGQFAKFALEQMPSARVYCFEPIPEVAARLRAWTAARGDVTVVEAALGDVPGRAVMQLHAEHSPSSSLLKTTDLSAEIYPFTAAQRQVEVAVTTLDAAVAGFGRELERPILVKLDVQGFEGHVIRGGQTTFRAAKAVIVEVSLAGLYEGQSTFRDIFRALDELGFEYAGNLAQAYGKDGAVIYLDAVFVRRS